MPPQRPRLFLDVTTLCRWPGPAIGIPRVQHALVTWALAERPDVVPVVFCPLRHGFRLLTDRGRESLSLEVGLDLGGLPPALGTESPGAVPAAWRRRLEAALHGPRRWIAKPRWQAFLALDRQAEQAGAPIARRMAAALRERLASGRARRKLYDEAGRPRRAVPYAAALGATLSPAAGDTLILSGMDWFTLPAGWLAAEKARRGFAIALLCHDLIPLTHPQWAADDNAALRRYMHRVLPLAERLLVPSAAVARDCRDYCVAQGLAAAPARVVSLPLAPVAGGEAGELPAGLRPGGYALFVSTVEVRKNHALLVEVWRRLRARGLPQRHDFKLVFVGRPGWKVAPLLRDLASEATRAEGLLWFPALGDAGLAALYRDAAFCLFPSHYEGFGLPVAEAFARGKAVIASTGGSLPEVVAGLSPCLDPLDTAAWEALLARWIEEPAARRPWEEAITRGFRPPSPAEAAAALFAAAAEGQ